MSFVGKECKFSAFTLLYMTVSILKTITNTTTLSIRTYITRELSEGIFEIIKYHIKSFNCLWKIQSMSLLSPRRNLHFGKLGSSSARHLRNPKAGKFSFELIQLLQQLFLIFRPKLGTLNFALHTKEINSKTCKIQL
jgi:hypothetical protein